MLTTACTVPCSEPALALAGSGNAAAPFQAAPGFAQALQRQTEQARDTSREAERRAERRTEDDARDEHEAPAAAPAPRRDAAAAAPPAEAKTPRGATPHDERPTRPAAAATARALPERTSAAASAGTLVAAAAAAGEASCMDVDGAAHLSDDGSAPADAAPALPGAVAPEAPTLPPEALLAWVAGLALPASPAPAPAGNGAAARPGRTQTDGAATTAAAGASDAITSDPIPAHAAPLGRAAAPDGAAAVDASSSGSAASAPASARRDERATGPQAAAAAADSPANPAAGAAPALPAPGDAIAALLHEPALQRPGALADAATATTTATSAASAALAALPAGAAAAPLLSSDAGTALQAELREPLGSAQFAPALASRLTVLVRGGIEHAQLRLNPAEMGPIEVRIRIDGAHTQVDFSAAQAQTRQVLQEAVPVLAGALREAGLTLTGGGVFEQPRQPRGEHAAHDGRAAQPQRQGRALDDTLSAAAAATARPARARGVVDLYA